MKFLWLLVVAVLFIVCDSFVRAADRDTDPDVGRVALTNIVRSPAGVMLGWSDGGPDFSYTVQMRSNLADAPWLTPRGTRPWPMGEREYFDPAGVMDSGVAGRFYRVVIAPIAVRGKLVASQELRNLTAQQINLLLFLTQVALTVQNEVKVYRLTYETVDPWGARVLASGALAVPQVQGRTLGLVSYQHGTVAKRSEAPSNVDSTEQLLGVVMAGSGYATVLPDYLGLGDAAGVHPYHHAASTATAAVDLLRAARSWCEGQGVTLNGQLFLMGYSQGGHATMALHRELEEYHAEEFQITASAPMAGAYDLSGVTADDALSGRSLPNPYYFGMLLASYQEVYRLAGSLGELFVPPYDKTLPPLLDGQHSGGEINKAIPSDVTKVLKPEYLEGFRSRLDHPLRVALKENDLYRWTPKAPLRLFHCRGDEDVLFRNSEVALSAFHERGATHVQLIVPISAADHGECSIPSLILAKQWFDSFKPVNP